MLTQVADGVLLHTSEFMQTNTVVVHSRDGVLLIDPGVTVSEIACLARDLSTLGQPVVAGFSTHPHWDHLLWDRPLGEAPRYGTARCAADAEDGLSEPGAKDAVAAHLPPHIGTQLPLDLIGAISGLPADAARVPWDGPLVRIVEHQAHAPGHASLLIEEHRVLVVGDMLSDILIPMLDDDGTADPIQDYLNALALLEDVATGADAVVPGHGSVARAEHVRARIGQDRAYVHALGDGIAVSDPRLAPEAYGKDFLPSVHAGQLERHAARSERGRTSA